MATSNIYNLTDTWTEVGTTYTSIKMNATDTASASGTLLMDLQVGSSSKFKVSKGGHVLTPTSFGIGDGGSAGASVANSISGANNAYIDIGSAGHFRFVGAGVTDIASFHFGTKSLNLTSTGSVNFTSSTNSQGTVDLALARAAAGSLNITDGTNFGFVNAAGYRLTSDSFNAQTGTTYTLVAADNGKTVTLNNALAITLTVPSGLGAGFSCTIIQLGAGQVTVSGSGATINSYSSLTKLSGQHAAATLIAYAANTFNLAGTLSA